MLMYNEQILHEGVAKDTEWHRQISLDTTKAGVGVEITVVEVDPWYVYELSVDLHPNIGQFSGTWKDPSSLNLIEACARYSFPVLVGESLWSVPDRGSSVGNGVKVGVDGWTIAKFHSGDFESPVSSSIVYGNIVDLALVLCLVDVAKVERPSLASLQRTCKNR